MCAAKLESEHEEEQQETAHLGKDRMAVAEQDKAVKAVARGREKITLTVQRLESGDEEV